MSPRPLAMPRGELRDVSRKRPESGGAVGDETADVELDEDETGSAVDEEIVLLVEESPDTALEVVAISAKVFDGILLVDIAVVVVDEAVSTSTKGGDSLLVEEVEVVLESETVDAGAGDELMVVELVDKEGVFETVSDGSLYTADVVVADDGLDRISDEL